MFTHFTLPICPALPPALWILDVNFDEFSFAKCLK